MQNVIEVHLEIGVLVNKLQGREREGGREEEGGREREREGGREN